MIISSCLFSGMGTKSTWVSVESDRSVRHRHPTAPCLTRETEPAEQRGSDAANWLESITKSDTYRTVIRLRRGLTINGTGDDVDGA